MVSELLIVALTLLAALLAAVAQYLFKLHLPRFKFNLGGILALVRSRMVILGLAVYAISLLIYLGALKLGQLSFVYPTFASVFLFVLLISKFKLHEHISITRAAGVLVILAGILLVVFTY